MLQQQLIAKTRPLANKENMVYWGNYRITVLSPRLFRIEQNLDKVFRDCATQAIWFRDVEKVPYDLHEGVGYLEIKTEKCTLRLRAKRSDCQIDIGNGYISVSNEGNLKGTYRTLDGCDGDKITYPVHGSRFNVGERIRLEDGVCSRTGVAVYDDANSLTLDENGEIKEEKGLGTDEYVFAFGDDYRGAVNALYTLCGYPPMLPRFAFGNWWSRYFRYTEREYMQMLGRFEDEEIPLTVVTLDTDWHYSLADDIRKRFHLVEKNLTKKKFIGPCDRGDENKIGWTGYTFHEELFPDPVAFLEKLNASGYHVTLNLHPAQGVRFWEKQYRDMANVMGKDPVTNEYIPFDFTDANFINAYFSLLLKPYETIGVSFWWVDWQQGKFSKIDGLDALWSLNHYHYLHAQESKRAPLILSRYCGVGAHRYPVGFSGDTTISWDTLRYLTYFTPTASNIGYGWWSHDIGGHNNGEKNDELYMRFLQFGVFSPINRLHCTNSSTITKEPFAYGHGVGELAKKWLRFRHRLIPFLYSRCFETHTKGLSLIEPTYYEWKTHEAYQANGQYIFGGNFLVYPIVQPAEKEGIAKVSGWIPQGVWTDIFTGDSYDGGKKGTYCIFYRGIESIPVLAKAGAILPLSMDDGNDCGAPKNLEIWTFAGNGSFTMYEQSKDGEAESLTSFKANERRQGKKIFQSIEISTRGDENAFVENRKLKIVFKNIKDGKISLFVDGKETPVKELVRSEVTVELNVNARKRYAVTVCYQAHNAVEASIERAREILLRSEGDNGDKQRLFDAIVEVSSLEEYRNTVQNSNVREYTKLRLLENLSLSMENIYGNV